jgi:hypothetical protein
MLLHLVISKGFDRCKEYVCEVTAVSLMQCKEVIQMKVCCISCNVRAQPRLIRLMVLQNCMDLQKHVPGPHSEEYPSSRDVNHAVNIKVEEVSDVEVEEEHPMPMTFIGIKAEHEVSYMFVCPLFGRSCTRPELSVFRLVSVCLYGDTALMNGF